MRRLIAIILIAFAAWSTYWVIGKTAKYSVMNAWISDRRAAGWDITYSDFRVVGYPNRFDSRFRDLKIFDPVSDITWRAPLFDILALSYQPNHIIAAFARQQTLMLPHETVTIDSRKMLASVLFEPDTKLAVERISLRAEELALKSDHGWLAKAQKVAISTRQSSVAKFAQEVVIDAQAVTPTRAIKRALDPKNRLPATIERLYLDLVLGFDAPWDRIAIEEGAPEVTAINLTRMTLGWGQLGLAASGDLDVTKSGEINGTLTLKIKNWRQVLDLFVTSGAFDQRTARTIANGLTLLTQGSAEPDSLSIPLTLKAGKMSLGPIPLGPAPIFIR